MFFTLTLLVGGAICVYLSMATHLYFNQRRYQYLPTHKDIKGEGQESLEPWRDDRGNFLGYWRRFANANGLVLAFHGNDEEALDAAWLREILPPNKALFLMEYPGYGARPGAPSEKAFFEAADAKAREKYLKSGYGREQLRNQLKRLYARLRL